MPKLLNRIVALILVPCLLTNPSSAAWEPLLQPKPPATAGAIVSSQALLEWGISWNPLQRSWGKVRAQWMHRFSKRPEEVLYRLRRAFGNQQALVIQDEVAKSVARLSSHPEAAEQETRQILQQVRLLTFPRGLIYLATRDKLQLFLLGLFPCLALVYWFIWPPVGIGMTAGVVFTYIIVGARYYHTLRSTNGMYFYDRIFIRARSDERILRRIIAHETAHRYFSEGSFLEEAFSALRLLEEGLETVELFIFEAIVERSIAQLRKYWRDVARGPNGERDEPGKAEPRWAYDYGYYMGQSLYALLNPDWRKIYETIRDLGAGRPTEPLNDALSVEHPSPVEKLLEKNRRHMGDHVRILIDVTSRVNVYQF